MTWQPEPDQSSPEGPGGNYGVEAPGSPSQALPQAPPQAGSPAQAPPRAGGLRRAIRQLAFGVLLTAGLAGLALSAVGVAHQLLPRRFTLAQRRAISAWEMERRWRALPAGTIFPASVSYELPATAVDATSNLVLNARRLGISPATSCASAVSGIAIRVLSEHGCSAAMRATYADSSGSLVATITVAVLPSAAAARAAVRGLPATGLRSLVVRTLRIASTPAAGFGDPERQLSRTADVGSYVIMATAGFSDGRRHMPLVDRYLDTELVSLVSGLQHTAISVLGGRVPLPSCPGTPGC